MPNTTRLGATATDTRDDIESARSAIEAQTKHGDTEAVQAWTERLNHLMDEAHEQAHREDERRWARQAAMDAGLGMFNEDTDAIVGLAQTILRQDRLWVESGRRIKSHYVAARQAAEELHVVYGAQINRGESGAWVIEFV